MSGEKLYIVLMGLPARGKSTLAVRLQDNLRRDGVTTRIFNNGNLRRKHLPLAQTSLSAFYSPDNLKGLEARDGFARLNMQAAKAWLRRTGTVAILDATNASRRRRQMIETFCDDHPVLYIECVNDDEEIIGLMIREKTRLPEFSRLQSRIAETEFLKRILYYKMVYTPLGPERNFIRLDSLQNRILEEKHSDPIALYARLRDYLVTDEVKNLFLIRHAQTPFNVEDRIGGDPRLTSKGRDQARALGRFFASRKISYIFTSSKQRTQLTAQAICKGQADCRIVPLREFDEIAAGVCEGMTYTEIKHKMPEIFRAREANKYFYAYPEGESYAMMKSRIETGIKKAFFLNRRADNIMIVGHQAVNRMILSHFLYRREEDVPFIYTPQDRFYHIVSTQNKKLFELKRYD